MGKNEYLIPEGQARAGNDGQVVNKGESIVDGEPDPHDILRLQGVEALPVTSPTKCRTSIVCRA